MNLADAVRTIPDFPAKGIMFRDITTLIQDPQAFGESITKLIAALGDPDSYDVVVGIESRGFIFGTPVAYANARGFVPVRKPGKLPCETISCSYDLEYGSNTLEIHKDALKPGDRVVIIDDLIATGGSAQAAITLCEELGAKVVKCGFIIELPALKGRENLKDYDIVSLIEFDGE